MKCFPKHSFFIQRYALLCCLLLFTPSLTIAALISSDDLFLSPSLVAEDFYTTHFSLIGGTQTYTAADLGADSILSARILPLLNPNISPTSSEGEYTDADLSGINLSNYASYFFRQPNVDYFADLTASVLDVSYLSSGQYFVELSAEKNGVVFTRMFHDQVEDFFAELPPKVPKEKASVSRKVDTPSGDLHVVSEKDPHDNGFNKNARDTLTNDGKNVKGADSLAAAKKAIEDAYKANGNKKISVVLYGHGAPGVIKIGTELITDDKNGDMTPLEFQKMIDPYVKSIEFFSCNVAKGAEGNKFLKDFASSIGLATGYQVTVTGGVGYFDVKATGKKLTKVPEPPVFALLMIGCVFCLVTAHRPRRPRIMS